jgi:predicted pyridoxine 5'-phosphate oxidase superfamily flavin-nucleotide-binding protein
LKEVVELSLCVDYVFIATADAKGLPHIAGVGSLADTSEGLVAIQEWFCPTTVSNLKENPNISIIIWDPSRDFGYQMLGQLERIEEVGILDGYVPEKEAESRLPQEKERLLIRPFKVVKFCQAPHTDIEE